MHPTRYPTQKYLLVLALLLALTLSVVASSYSLGDAGDQRHSAVAGRNVADAPTMAALAANRSAGEVLTETNCRYGVGYIPESPGSDAWMSTLGAGWYGNFSVYPLPQTNAQFIPTLRLRQDIVDGVRQSTYTFNPSLPQLSYFITTSPGSLWLVGNEIDIDNYLQDNIMPDVYARAYHEAYHFIKEVDPTAQVGIGSVTMATPGRLQYLDIVLDTYKTLYGTEMPIDVWNFHLYILSERTYYHNNYADGKIALGTDPELAIKSSAQDPAKCPSPDLPDTAENDPRPDVYCKAEYDSVRIFREQVIALRTWMRDHGEQDKPLILSEFSLLPAYVNPQPGCTCEMRQDEFGRCMCPERVTAYMEGTIGFMEGYQDEAIGYPADDHRLVQRWLWYSLVTTNRVGHASNLIDPSYRAYLPGAEDALTMMGRTYREFANSPTNTTNLVAGSARSSTVFVENPTDTGAATITAALRNTGTRSVVKPFAVTFYADENLTQFIGSVLVNPNDSGPVMGCSWIDPDHIAQFEWRDLPVGTHQYWAKIDSGLSVDESSEADNVTTSGTITVYAKNAFPHELFIPLVRH